MRSPGLVLAAFAFGIFSGCVNEQPLIPDSDYRDKLEKDFADRKILAKNRSDHLFTVFENKLTSREEHALMFLFAYMPLSDLADYDGSFFLDAARYSLKAADEMPWGKAIPWDIFLHYVLPVRINNENLDSFRIKYYDEIKKRISGLGATEAALEINHWCHEKVTYQPSDIRTSGPVSTILSARGRCGEESTFTVAALRTAGLPARQVYTPRWAHSDDNHAWVEVWIEGNWYYLGACEPEPVLDRGWFTEPARRAMLVHTKSFGAPAGKENTIVTFKNFSVVNNLSKYAVTKKIHVKVTDSSNQPVENAMVDYCLYNYAEFYPLASVPTGSNGISQFETGLGDLLIWAYKEGKFAFREISVSGTDTLLLKLGNHHISDSLFSLDLEVPLKRVPLQGPPPDLSERNNRRIEEENRIREAYISSWMPPEDAAGLAMAIKADTSAVKDLISRSMGNYSSVATFLQNVSPEKIQLAVRMLKSLSDKDLRDTPPLVFHDHLEHATGYDPSASPAEIYDRFLLSPRIANELIVAWRGYLQKSLGPELMTSAKSDPQLLVRRVQELITINDTDNYYKTPVTPRGVDQLRVSDSFSRDIYFIALCRSAGIPARLEEGTGIPQYYSGSKWHDADFNPAQGMKMPKGHLRLTSDENNPVPEYYIHFTLARLENGRYRTLEYEYNRKITGFREELELPAGYYMLVTGNRISDSRILATISFFELKENEHRLLHVKLRKDSTPQEILGRVDLNSILTGTEPAGSSLEKMAEIGLVLAWIEPEKEPSKHILNDLPLLKQELENRGVKFIFFYKSGSDRIIDQEAYKDLPSGTLFISDNNAEYLKKLCGQDFCSTAALPVIILLDSNGRILMRSEGYRIGIGEQILKSINIK